MSGSSRPSRPLSSGSELPFHPTLRRHSPTLGPFLLTSEEIRESSTRSSVEDVLNVPVLNLKGRNARVDAFGARELDFT